MYDETSGCSTSDILSLILINVEEEEDMDVYDGLLVVNADIDVARRSSSRRMFILIMILR